MDAKVTAKHVESAFLANGMQADPLKDLLRDAVGASLTFDRLLMGFRGTRPDRGKLDMWARLPELMSS